MRRWLAEVHPEAIDRIDAHPSHYFSSNPRAMERLLSDIEADHGGVTGLLVEIGVRAETLEALRARMLVRD
jgi:hypothetical protein